MTESTQENTASSLEAASKKFTPTVDLSTDAEIAESNTSIKAASGRVTGNDRLQLVLYLLMRDHLPCGVVEELVARSKNYDTVYSNGWLAQYAGYLSNVIRTEKQHD